MQSIVNSSKAKLQWIVYASLAWQLVQSLLWYAGQFTSKQINLIVYTQPRKYMHSLKEYLTSNTILFLSRLYCLNDFSFLNNFKYSKPLSSFKTKGNDRRKRTETRNKFYISEILCIWLSNNPGWWLRLHEKLSCGFCKILTILLKKHGCRTMV